MINVNRVKEILTAPQKEWTVIDGENEPHLKVFTGYVLPLSLIPAIAAFIGYGFVGYSFWGSSVTSGILHAIMQWATMVGSIYLIAFVVSILAESFGAKKDFDKAFSLVAYSYTPMLLAGIFHIIPVLSILAFLAGLYGLYLLYLGIQPMMKAHAEKNASYFLVSLIVAIVITGILTFILSIIIGAIVFTGAAAYYR